MPSIFALSDTIEKRSYKIELSIVGPGDIATAADVSGSINEFSGEFDGQVTK